MFRCMLCPLHCGTDRDTGTGPCHAGPVPKVARADLHFWEEPCISGKSGSGTVFFSGCNMHCIFCQNHVLQDGTAGKATDASALSDLFLMLQAKGANNINLVTPTPHLRTIRKAILLSIDNGLTLPIVYNSGGYESMEGLRMMEGLVDVYLPDFKYATGRYSSFLSGIPDYFEAASKAIPEMYRQAGDLKLDENGIAVSGLIIRHLVLPGCVSETRKVFDYLATVLPLTVSISLMRQYAPTSETLPKPFNRKITDREYDQATEYLLSLGYTNIMLQEKDSATLEYTPSFTVS